jgi:hypothetical protein
MIKAKKLQKNSTFLITNQVKRCHWKKREERERERGKSWIMGLVHNECQDIIKLPPILRLPPHYLLVSSQSAATSNTSSG